MGWFCEIYMKCMFYCGCRWKWRVTIAANFQFKQLEGRSLKTIRASTGFEAVTSAKPVRCSTNWAVKLHIGSEVNLLTNVPMNLRSTNVLLLLPMYLRSTKCISYIFHIISLHGTGRHELNKLTSLPMCGFRARLVKHRTGIAEVTSSNPVEALIFSGFFLPIA